jgi:hypothetical protein
MQEGIDMVGVSIRFQRRDEARAHSHRISAGSKSRRIARAVPIPPAATTGGVDGVEYVRKKGQEPNLPSYVSARFDSRHDDHIAARIACRHRLRLEADLPGCDRPALVGQADEVGVGRAVEELHEPAP